MRKEAAAGTWLTVHARPAAREGVEPNCGEVALPFSPTLAA